jgi:hypothetical protein
MYIRVHDARIVQLEEYTYARTRTQNEYIYV